MTKPHEVGTRFPFISLEKALRRAEQLYQADSRGRPLALQTAFTAWNYSDKSSGGHQTVAALKMYGLITDDGANSERRVQLTKEALHYFADEREDERFKAIRKFALHPKLLTAIWRDWDGSAPADNIARSQLKIDRKLNDQSARSLLSIYKDNLAFADLGKPAGPASQDSTLESQETEEEEEETEAPLAGDLIQWSPAGINQFRDPARVRAVSPDGEWVFVDGSETGISTAEIEIVKRTAITGREASSPPPQAPTLALPSASSNMKRDVFSLDEGEVTLTFPATLSRASYEDLVDWLDLVKRKAERAVREPPLK